jgi:hypothetical protein
MGYQAQGAEFDTRSHTSDIQRSIMGTLGMKDLKDPFNAGTEDRTIFNHMILTLQTLMHARSFVLIDLMVSVNLRFTSMRFLARPTTAPTSFQPP